MRRHGYAEGLSLVGVSGTDGANHDPYSGALYIFRGRRGDLLKILFWDRQGMCLYAKKLDRGRFIWPQAKDGVVSLTMAQLSMLLESIDWRATAWTARPDVAV